jgi:hypothetical protein
MLCWSGVRRSSTSCIILKMTPNSVWDPVAMTIPEPRPTHIDRQQFPNRRMKTRAIPNQCAHICDTSSFGHLGALGTCTRVLPPCRGFTCQATLVNLEVDSGEDT